MLTVTALHNVWTGSQLIMSCKSSRRELMSSSVLFWCDSLGRTCIYLVAMNHQLAMLQKTCNGHWSAMGNKLLMWLSNLFFRISTFLFCAPCLLILTRRMFGWKCWSNSSTASWFSYTALTRMVELCLAGSKLRLKIYRQTIRRSR